MRYDFTKLTGESAIPPISDFSWLNQASSTIEETSIGHLMYVDGTGTNNMRGRMQSIPSPSGAWSITINLKQWTRGNFNECGILLRDTVGSRIIFFGYSYDQLDIVKQDWNSETSFNSSTTYDACGAGNIPHEFWFRIVNDGSNNSFQYSVSGGDYWIELLNESETAWLANPADEYGYGGDSSGFTDFYFRVDSYETT